MFSKISKQFFTSLALSPPLVLRESKLPRTKAIFPCDWNQGTLMLKLTNLSNQKNRNVYKYEVDSVYINEQIKDLYDPVSWKSVFSLQQQLQPSISKTAASAACLFLEVKFCPNLVENFRPFFDDFSATFGRILLNQSSCFALKSLGVDIGS